VNDSVLDAACGFGDGEYVGGAAAGAPWVLSPVQNVEKALMPSSELNGLFKSLFHSADQELAMTT